MARAFGARRAGRLGVEPTPIQVEEHAIDEDELSSVIRAQRQDPPGVVLSCRDVSYCSVGVRVYASVRGETKPLEGVHVRLERMQGGALDDVTGPEETAFEPLRAGAEYRLSLPAIDTALCEAVQLDDPVGTNRAGEAPWAHPEQVTVGEIGIEAAPGDCMASLAFEYGTSQAAIELDNPAANERPHQLVLGEAIAIPAIEPFAMLVEAGKRYKIVVDVPRVTLLLRMETYNLRPRPGVLYEIQIFDEDWTELDGARGSTDEQGMITLETYATARFARLVLRPVEQTGEDEAGEPECYSLAIGEVQPPDRMSGVRARLNDLAFYCGEDPPEREDESTMDLTEEDTSLANAKASFWRLARGESGEEPDWVALQKELTRVFGS